MRTTPLVSRLACAAIALALAVGALAVGAPTEARAATVAGAWRARVGISGVNGMATVQAPSSGAASISLQLLRLRPATTLAVTLRKGTCGTPGALLLQLPSIRTSSTGAGIRTIRLPSTQVSTVRAALKGTGKVAFRVGTGSTAKCGVLAPVVAQVGYLARQGSDLSLGGKPFREISFDKFDLLHQYVVTANGTWEHDLRHGVPAAETALRLLGANGFRVVRVNASPFYPSWFEDAFFDVDPAREAQKRREYFAAFDQMLDACDRHGIRIVATLVWNPENLGDLGHHSLHEGLVDRRSIGRQRVEAYVREVVTRYRNRPTIAMWELGNEWNLVADIQFTNGPFAGDPAGDVNHPGPVVRDARNNCTSDELSRYYAGMATFIRAVDGHHLVTTGDSSPRPSAMHLLRAARAAAPVDWTPDSADELAAYLRLVNPDPIDVISIHYYDDGMLALGGRLGSPENLRFFARVAGEIGKPLFIGEIGLDAESWRYDTTTGLDLLRATLAVLVELKVPLTLYWAFADDRQLGQGDASLRYGKTDEALGLIEAANAALRR